jgi:putative membrane protein
MRLIIRILINAVALWVTALILPNIQLTSDVLGLLVVAIIFGLINALIKPIVKLLSLPITLITLGLFTLVINAAMLALTAWLAGDRMVISGDFLQRIITLVLGALIITIVSTVLSWILPDDKR